MQDAVRQIETKSIKSKSSIGDHGTSSSSETAQFKRIEFLVSTTYSQRSGKYFHVTNIAV